MIGQMADRPIILVFIAQYLPSYKSGGPVRTISNLVDLLGQDFDFRIITSDRDLHDDRPFENIKSDDWQQVGNARVFYCSPAQRSLRDFIRIIKDTPHDAIYLNSYFEPQFSILPMVAYHYFKSSAKPLVIAPRGEFSQGALALKRLKKSFFISSSKYLFSHRNSLWHASTSFEEEDINRVIGSKARTILVAPDLPEIPNKTSGGFKGRSKPLKLCFLSRVSEKKNLSYALTILKQIRFPLEMNIFGPIGDAAYWRVCEEIIQTLPNHIEVNYEGSIPHEKVNDALGLHDLFFFPSLGENYGHVIPEAMLAGVPVLIADTTPFRDLWQAGAGWDLPLDDEQGFVRSIEYCDRLDDEQYRTWRQEVYRYAEQKLNLTATIEANRVFWNKVLEG